MVFFSVQELHHVRIGMREVCRVPSVAIGPNSDPDGAIPVIVAGDPPDRHCAYKSRQKNTRPVTA